jgi:hypothetical protein
MIDNKLRWKFISNCFLGVWKAVQRTSIYKLHRFGKLTNHKFPHFFLVRHAPFIGENSAGRFSIAMRTVSPDIFLQTVGF